MPAAEDLLLDRFDVALLAALQRDAKATHQQVGDELHLSASQVSRRIHRLEAGGLIRRYVAMLDPQLLALGVRAFVYVTLARHGGEEGLEFEQAMSTFPEVLDCYAVTGESDYVLQIVSTGLAELSDSVLKRLMRLRGVTHIRSNIVLQCIKTTTELPLEQIGRNAVSARRAKLIERSG